MAPRAVPRVLVALHGHDDDPAVTAAWAHRLCPDGVRVELVEAPSGDRDWFRSGPRGVDPGSLRSAIAAVLDRVAAVADLSAPAVVVGFSQGAAVALSLPPQDGIAGVVGICAFLPERADGVAPEGDGPPTLVLGARDDDAVPAFMASDAATGLRARGRRTVDHDTVPGGHGVGPEAAATVARWWSQHWPGRVRWSLHLPVDRVEHGAEFTSAQGIAEVAAHCEAVGADAVYVTDHPAPDSRWLAAGGHHALEPTVALATAAAATRRLGVHTHVYVAAYRNPFLSAKALASLDLVSDGRLILGVAAGYLRPEFAALGSDFAARGRHLDQILALWPRIWNGETVADEGDGFRAKGVTALPRPVQRPHPPIWVGGNSPAAMRRAVTLAQGWCPFPTTAELAAATRTASIGDLGELGAALEVLDATCRDHGRADRPTVCFAPFSAVDWAADPDGGAAAVAAEVEELGAMGVDWVTVSVPGTTRGDVLRRTTELAGLAGLTPVTAPPRTR